MHFVFKTILVGAALCSMAVSTARAEIFYIEDQDDRFSISFPDLWAKVENQKPDDKLTIAGPGVNDFATCRVRVREDKRFLIYPREYASEIQRTSFTRDFWTDYLGEYDELTVDAFKDDSGVGKSYASMAEVSFMTAEGSLVRKRGLMFAGLYHDRAFIVDCSSQASLYEKWRPVFLSIIKSVDMSKVIFETPAGYYRDFLADPENTIEGPKKLDAYKF
jgi:hypothetical protein